DAAVSHRAVSHKAITDVLRSPGHPLDSATRALFEPRFGRDFSDVRVHTDSSAAASARSINANAYTLGENLVFGAGQYAPESAWGDRKSTRLNSSHDQISYAVFCLKKKKKTITYISFM